MSSLPFAALAQPSGFSGDPRFLGTGAGYSASHHVEEADPVARALEEGYAAGLAEAAAAAEARFAEDEAARGALSLSLARLNSELEEALRTKLMLTVEALCETALAPLALDKKALLARVTRAAAMLARADDDKLLRLHPDDLKLIAAQLPADLPCEADPALMRGALRIETSAGGVEDGPDNWRRAIAETLAHV